MGTPVALLGRNGPARERMREALSLIGARVVLEDEPGAIDARTLADAEPVAVLVALEPAIEDALEALEPALQRPGLTVIFDEAELAARREGWDAQRWARHLAAKLHGHGDVLPPGAEQEPAWAPEPGRPVTPAQLHSAQPVEAHLQAAAQALDEVPGDTLFAPLEWPLDSDPVADSRTSAKPMQEPIDDPFAGLGRVEPAAPVAPRVAPPAPQSLGDSSTWGLVEDLTIVDRPRAEVSFDHLPDGGLSLVDLEPAGEPARLQGGVLVMAGIGGPDAIRRLLGALPAGFPRAVLVRMALDGGQYGNLVRQMGRVSTLPVVLAEPGQALVAGKAYILSDGVGLVHAQTGLAFTGDAGDLAALVSALPADDSAVLLLSGASEALVPSVLALAEQGAWVAGQSADGCYDPAAANRLAQQGRPCGDPAQLAQSLAERWPASAASP